MERPRAVETAVHESRRGLEHCAELLVGHVVERTPRRDARVPQRLRLPHVPNARDDALVEQRVADLAPRRLRAETREHPVELGRLREDVGTEMRRPPAVAGELEHGPVPEHRLMLGAAQHEPRQTAPLHPAPLDAPAAVHPQVAAQHKPAVEVEQEVLADRLDGFERSAVKALDEPLRGSTWMRRLDLDLLSRQYLQPPRRAVQGIAFGHSRSVVGHDPARSMSAGLNIAALAQRTGIPPDTLRKWEQRYRILQPDRTAGGQRRYSERDVARVEWLRERLDEGYRIGEAARLLGTIGVEPGRKADDHLRGILDAVECGEPTEIGIRLDQAFALLGVDATLADVLQPLLRTVGERWEDGTLSVAEEHLVSEAVRSRLGHLLGDAGGGVRGVAVLACAPGERHELGLMMAAIALRRDGWKVVYLGADTPLADALALATRLESRVLGISLASSTRADAVQEVLAERGLPEGLVLVVGGGGASNALARRLGGVYAGPELTGAVEAVRALAA
jgi:MerR family transcriptional regulator, light-induced transcriptional regulator